MAWLKSGSSWIYRHSMTIDNSAGAAGAIDATIDIPSDWDAFWTTVNSAGDDIRVADADGYTLLTYDLASWNSTTRVGTIELDNYSAPAGAMLQVHLYWGNSGASAGLSAFAPAAAKSGVIEVGTVVGPRIVTVPERPGEARPRVMLAKASTETIWVTWDLSREMQRRLTPNAGSDLYEEIDYASVNVYLAGVDQTGMYTTTATRYLPNHQVLTEIKAGSDGSDYTIQLTVVTTTPAGKTRTLKRRAWLKVRDVDES